MPRSGGQQLASEFNHDLRGNELHFQYELFTDQSVSTCRYEHDVEGHVRLHVLSNAGPMLFRACLPIVGRQEHLRAENIQWTMVNRSGRSTPAFIGDASTEIGFDDNDDLRP